MIADKLTTVTENQQKVYDAGYQKGKEESGEIFFTSHGTMYQKNMVITTDDIDGFYAYAYRYANKMETLYIPYLQSKWTASSTVFQGCTSLKSAILPRITQIGAMFFYDCTSLETLVLGSEEYPMTFIATYALQRCSALKELTYIGTINGSLNLQWSTKLSCNSIVNLFNALSSDVIDQTLTLSLEAVNNAFETSEGAADGSTSEEWINLVATKTNWSIVLV